MEFNTRLLIIELKPITRKPKETKCNKKTVNKKQREKTKFC